MDDGRPAKAKWWSRPRHHVPAPDATVASGPETSENVTSPQNTDGDYELAGPAGAEPGTGEPSAGAEDVVRTDVQRADVPRTGAAADPRTDAASDPAPDLTPSQDSTAHKATSQDSTSDDSTSQDRASVGDRVKPLHDPDPYSTPPYGEPGPWAPAPPVQHPGITPARGAHQAAAHEGPHDAPMSGAPAPESGSHEAAGHPTAAYGTPAHGTPPGATPLAPGPFTPSYASPPLADPAHNPWQNYDPWAPAPLQQNGAVVEDPGARRGRRRRGIVVGGVLIALVSGGVGGAFGSYLERNGGMSDISLPQAGVEDTGRAPDSVAGIAASALPGVVTLHVKGSEAEGTGTGFVLDRRGHILTNNHVVEPAGSGGEISVTFSGGETAKGEVVGRDSGYDLAVVKVSGVTGLRPLPLGNSDNVRVGDPVVAIGAPFDLANTVTSGIISAKERPITAGGEKGDGSDISYVDALQTDAPINPGNSGGPLVDSRAQVIGINSAIRSAGSGSDLDGGQAGSIGLGFAIPINQGKRVAEELINNGRATHPVIGVTLDLQYAGDGARISAKAGDGGSAVTAGGPGAKAGLRAGDVVTEVDGQRVHSGEELIARTRAHRPGDRLRLTILRDGAERSLTLVLGSSGGG